MQYLTPYKSHLCRISRPIALLIHLVDIITCTKERLLISAVHNQNAGCSFYIRRNSVYYLLRQASNDVTQQNRCCCTQYTLAIIGLLKIHQD